MMFRAIQRSLGHLFLVGLCAVLLCACGDEEEYAITPNESEPVEAVEEDLRVSTESEDLEEPFKGHSIDYGMSSNWLHVPGTDIEMGEEDQQAEGQETEDAAEGQSDDDETEEASGKSGGVVLHEDDVPSSGREANIPLKDVDTFYLYPTVYSDLSKDAPAVQEEISDEARDKARKAYIKQATLFEQSTNVYAPFYRQTNLTEYAELDPGEVEAFQMAEQRTDVYAALDYYFTEFNPDRPFILAGHSQGAMMVKLILEEYMEIHPEIYERMVAAYVIGWSVTEEDLDQYSHLKFAESAEDTGVIISYNTEGKGNKNSFVVLEGAMAINPISWTREKDKAEAEDNMGSRLYNEKEKRYEIHSNLADARVDEKRGVVVCETDAVDFDKTPGDILGTKSFHTHDIDLYYENLRANVRERCDAFLRTSE